MAVQDVAVKALAKCRTDRHSAAEYTVPAVQYA